MKITQFLLFLSACFITGMIVASIQNKKSEPKMNGYVVFYHMPMGESASYQLGEFKINSDRFGEQQFKFAENYCLTNFSYKAIITGIFKLDN